MLVAEHSVFIQKYLVRGIFGIRRDYVEMSNKKEHPNQLFQVKIAVFTFIHNKFSLLVFLHRVEKKTFCKDLINTINYVLPIHFLDS